ncbi:putative transcription factor WD40-like family [Medicago truncatula]|uniref:Putative transcription factor WD40-like family n=1 Tax=Medicago truncatula TaxID=3880 RepID=A0A396I6Z6_MEDTR|nr:putative transcription factor WD40-like family [Medicago truncatula]
MVGVVSYTRDFQLLTTDLDSILGFIFHIFDHTNSVTSFRFSYDGQLHQEVCINLFKSRVIYVNPKGTVDGPKGAIEWFRWHLRGKMLFAGSDDSTARM